MRKLLCLMGGVMLMIAVQGQITASPYYINQRIPDLPLDNIINYKDSSASLSSFGHKLLLLDFWNTHCTACIAMFPKEDSLQKRYKNIFQIILVSSDKANKINDFLDKWKSKNNRLGLPIVTNDVFLTKFFPHMYIPHYVWIGPDGTFLGATSDAYVNSDTIENLWDYIKTKETDLKKRDFPDSWFRFPKFVTETFRNN